MGSFSTRATAATAASNRRVPDRPADLADSVGIGGGDDRQTAVEERERSGGSSRQTAGGRGRTTTTKVAAVVTEHEEAEGARSRLPIINCGEVDDEKSEKK